jgi:hypothetical protein
MWGLRQDAPADAFFDELAQRQGYWKTVQHSGEELFERWCGMRTADAAVEKSRIGDGLPDRTQAEMREERQAAADAVDALEKELQKAGMDLFCDATTIHVSKTPVGDPTNRRGDEESKSLCQLSGVLVFEGKQWRKPATKGGRVFHRSHWLKLPCASGKKFFVRAFEDLCISRLCQHAEMTNVNGGSGGASDKMRVPCTSVPCSALSERINSSLGLNPWRPRFR